MRYVALLLWLCVTAQAAMTESGSLARGLVSYYTLASVDAINTTNLFNRATGSARGAQYNTGSTNYVSTGPFSLGAFAFDGTNDYILTDYAALTKTAASATLWIKPNDPSVTARVFCGHDGILANEFSLQTFSGGVRGLVAGASTLIIGNTIAIAANNWIHIGMTFDGANLRLYTNGLLADTKAAVVNLSTNVQYFNIGIKNGETTEPYKGFVSQFKLYNRTLTAAEVAKLATASGSVFQGADNSSPTYVRATPRPQLFLDTDLDSDSDDIVDEVVIFTLEHIGYLDTIGAVVTSTNAFSAPCLAAIANYYGRSSLTIGANVTNCGNSASTYAASTAAAFPIAGKTNAYNTNNFADYRVVQRTVLAAAAANSVEYLTTGDWSSVLGLLQTSGDGISALSGPDLVAAKVRHWWCVAGVWPVGAAPSGGDLSGPCTNVGNATIALWPTTVPIIFNDILQSTPIYTGNVVMTNLSTLNPARHAWIDAFGGNGQQSGWSQTAILPIAFGLGIFDAVNINYSTPQCRNGTAIVGLDGSTRWVITPNRNQSFIYPSLANTNYSQVINSFVRDFP